MMMEPEAKPEVMAVRGVALIDRVIASLKKKKVAVPAPLDGASIDRMRLADGAPLPPSLRKLLAFHGPADELPGRWVEGTGAALEGVSIETLLLRSYDPQTLRYFDVRTIVEGLPGRCHVLDDETPLRFLYVGERDAWGEYPVLTLQDYDDCLEVVVDFPGLDVYFACRTGVVAKPNYYGGIIEHPGYGPMLRDVVARCFPKAQRRRRQHLFAAEFLAEGES